MTMQYYAGYWKDGEAVMNRVEIPAGSMVKVVMVSRFGDVGITEDLSAERGYGARVSLDALCDYAIDTKGN